MSTATPRTRTRTRVPVSVRHAEASEAPALHALISTHIEEGHLLPRSLEELAVHASRFVVATRGRRIVGCADLAVLSANVAEVRSLAVDRRERGSGVGTMMVDELRRRARENGFEKLCAFTHVPAYFIQMGFSIVPHMWLLEKVVTDCVKCAQFQRCGQYAMLAPVQETMATTGKSASHDLVHGIRLEHVISDEPAPHTVTAGCA